MDLDRDEEKEGDPKAKAEEAERAPTGPAGATWLIEGDGAMSGDGDGCAAAAGCCAAARAAVTEAAFGHRSVLKR